MKDDEKTVDPSPEELKAPVVATALLGQPWLIGRYRVEKLLGEGGFGRVYLAHDDQLQRLVAIKVQHRKLADRPEATEAYLIEARTVASLDHPNIVPIFDVGNTPDGLCYVVSKVIDGSDLEKKIRQSRPSYTETAGLIATIAEALHYAHLKRLVHRDIKPANILIDTNDKPYVADFGLALKEEDFGKGVKFAGTPVYMSPEQARQEGHRVDGRSDVFSLGVVFYELLVGRRPFKSDSLHELLEQITKVEPRPPRQVDDRIPKELERICFKALAKRTSERYLTAKDMADDLRHFLGSASEAEKPAVIFKGLEEGAISTPAPSAGPTPVSDQRPIKIVPKGLRSFNAQDADFFLELLPGPRDREGLPDSIRFWKTRIEEMDADNTFSVGLIFGPSGCGKSSLVKAGLLPRLAGHVIAVYVEATGDDTEVRLLKGLRKHCPDLPENLGVIETLAALRRGHYLPAGKKVVIILDQFEQWLHAKRTEGNTELLQALRHCDGERLQSIVMVRDDFGMAATRFMGALDIPILQGHNFATVDLFDLLHSCKVLAEFGRAFGRLPDSLGKCTKEQEVFLDQAVSGLAQEGKVISVQLALFAEMVKGKPWTPATLKEVGGMEGVGVTFLEETFAASTAPPQHRLHQNAAQTVLKALLPDIGTAIKGNMRSQQELLEASGYAAQPKDFNALLRILDGELRLITPTDPEGKEDGSGKAGEKYCQLTHDYLVPSLRDWLTRKQKETRKGRAELRLGERASLWTAKPENRHLPAWWEWANIRLFTRKKNWTLPQRKMMRMATRHHAVRGAALGLLLAVATITGLAIWEQVEERRNATHAAGLVQAVLNADTAQVPAIIGEMAEYRKWTDPLLVEEYDKAAAKSSQKLHASLALLPVDAMQVDYLFTRFLDAAPHEVPVIRDSLAQHKNVLLDKLWALVEMPQKDKESQRLRAAAAVAKYDPESQRWDMVQTAVANDLVTEPAVYLATWLESFRPVRAQLLAPLSAVYRDASRRDVERSLATEFLADYAFHQPNVLADLVMDADEKQFAVVFPKFEARAAGSLPLLELELTKKVVTQAVPILSIKENITQKESLVKIDGLIDLVSLPAKSYLVKMLEGKTYTMTMASTEVEAILVLQDNVGKQLAYHVGGAAGKTSLLDFVAPQNGTYKVHAASCMGIGSFSLNIVEIDAQDNAKEKLAKRQANAAVALLRMNQPAKVWPLLRHRPDPRLRSYLIHRLSLFGADAKAIIKRLNDEQELTIRQALILSLGDYGEKAYSPDERKLFLPILKEMYQTAADPGIHAASEWLLRTWQEEVWLKQVSEKWEKDPVRRAKRLTGIEELLAKDKEKAPPQWYVNGQGQTMVVIPGPVEFLMGSPPWEKGRVVIRETMHQKRIGRTFAIAAHPVTDGQYRCFDRALNSTDRYLPTPDCPIVSTSWHQAAAYCNWLSGQEGIHSEQWCYEIDSRGQVTKFKDNYLSLTGYRLPTEAEYEYAIRAGATTSRYYGESEELLKHYAWFLINSGDRSWPVGTKKPNDLGLFDMHGNVWCWCQESFKNYPQNRSKQPVEDTEDTLMVISQESHVLRGGSFFNLGLNVRSANRIGSQPPNRDFNFGFRVARTITP